MMSIAIGYMPGAFGQGGEDPNFLRQLVQVGDTYGYDSIWLSDRIVSHQFSLEPMVALSMVAAYSERLKFGTSVLALPLRNPVVLAKQIATLDYLSQGRCFPAVGLGQEDLREYEACGVSKNDRGQRTDEAIVLMRRLWEEDSVTHEGTFFTCHNVSITPKPFLQPSPPVWIGGHSIAAARRVGRVGDGWLVSRATPDDVRQGRTIIFETAAKHGRHIEDDHIGVVLGYYIASEAKQAQAKAEPFVTRQRPDVPFTAFSAVGTVVQVAEVIQQYIGAGASKFVVRPLCPGEESMAQLEIMGQEILPQFHQPSSRTVNEAMLAASSAR
jgi:probable F420-dependent oxidoreductase